MFDAPQIHAFGLPEGERDAASSISQNLYQLKRKVHDFQAALTLFDHATSQIPAAKASRDRNMMSLLHTWELIAARSCAISIHVFHRLEQAIDKLLTDCPSLHAHIDYKARKKAAKIFADSFPNFADVRDAAAHGSEAIDSPEKRAKHAVSSIDIPGFMEGTGEGTIVSEALNGRDYHNTFRRKLVSLSISEATLRNLESVLVLRFQMFAKVEAATEALSLQRLQGNAPKPPEDQSSRPR